MAFGRVNWRDIPVAVCFYFVFTLILVPVDHATWDSPIALAESVLVRIAVILAFLAATHLYIGTQGVVVDSIVPRPQQPAPAAAQVLEDAAKPPKPVLEVRDRKLIAIFAGLCMLERLCSQWSELIPANFTLQTALEWCWALFSSVCIGVLVRWWLFKLDPETGKLRPVVKTGEVALFTFFVLGTSVANHFQVLLHPASIREFVLTCIEQAINSLFLGAIAALLYRVCVAAIHSAGRPKLLSFFTFAAGVFAVIAYWDRKDLLAVQPGSVTIRHLVFDLVCALIFAFFLHRRLVSTFTPAEVEIPSVVPHSSQLPSDHRNPLANSGV
jgi:hypothetical protein